MNFILDPPSGYADSYLDVEFSANVKPHPKTIMRLFNEISNEQLDILGVSIGYILNGNEVVFKNHANITGHINIFNNDKMNKKFTTYRSVPIRCIAEHYDEDGNSVGSEEDTLLFYNEMYSLDAGIIPFDLIIHNASINIDEHEPLVIDIISGKKRKYELCVASPDQSIRCPIEILARAGKTTVEVPAAMLFYDLDLATNFRKSFKFFYVKHQGTTFSRLANRQYLPIQNSEMDFRSSGKLQAMPQDRLDPIRRDLSRQFVLSDRYLVFCPRESSGFAAKSEFNRQKLMDLTMLINEGQNMKAISRQVQQFASDETSKIDETQQAIRASRQHATRRQIRPKIPSAQIQLMRSISKTYDNISSTGRVKLRDEKQPSVSNRKAVRSFSSAPQKEQPKRKGGCAPCSRKRKKNG